MHKIGEDHRERLDIVAAQVHVVVTLRPKYTPKTCSGDVAEASTPCR